MTYFTQTTAAPRRFRGFSLLQMLLRADRAYRDRRHLRSLSDEQLDDVGLTRADLY